MNGRAWTPAAIAKLRALYPSTRTNVLARRMGRTITQVNGAASRYRVRKDPEFLREQGRIVAQHPRAVAKRFKPGNVPPNAGKKGWQAGGRSAETRFKKGHFPANRDPDFYVLGALRINAEGYIDMRVSFAKGACGWRTLHTLLWEDAHGPVPVGHCLRFRNGDRLDVEVNNLELLSRQEMMRRNSIHNLPTPLADAVRLLGTLKRQINRRTRNGNHGKAESKDAR